MTCGEYLAWIILSVLGAAALGFALTYKTKGRWAKK